MIWLIAATAMAAQSDPPLALPDVQAGAALFRSIGFKVKPRKQSGEFEISRRGDKCRLFLGIAGDPKTTPEPRSIYLSWTYAFPEVLPDDVALPEPWIYTASLDGSLTLQHMIWLDPKMTRKDVATEIESLWRARHKLDIEVIRPRRGEEHESNQPITGMPLDEHRIVHGLCRRDMDFLISKWSWASHQGWGYSGPPWITAGSVDSVEMFFRGLTTEMFKDKVSHIVLDTRVLIPGPDQAKWVADHQVGLGDMKLWPPYTQADGKGSRSDFTEEIDLSGGMSLAEFRARVVVFGRMAKGLSSGG